VAPIGGYNLADLYGKRANSHAVEVIPDTGCDASPSCLRCPLPRCKFDEPPKRVKQAARMAQKRHSGGVL
jgi:hypothetical protein